jgi:hypothetical protein
MKKASIFIVVLLLSVFLCGCTITSGVFAGMSYNSSDTSLSASYRSFDGSITQRLSLKADDEVSFSYQGDDGLAAKVKQSGDVIADIADGSVVTVPTDGTYDFIVEGEAKAGAFSLTWSVE